MVFFKKNQKSKLTIYFRAVANLECISRVPHYFVNFLLRSKVLPQIEHQLRRSLEVIALAIIELPKTAIIATFPDKFSLACTACWGKKADGYKRPTTPEPAEPKAKRQKCETDIRSTTKSDSWATSSEYDWSAIVKAESWGEVKVTDTASGWALSEVDEPESLFFLLGPTALPLTHAPGIVERSMRRIVSVTRPPSSVAKLLPLPEGIYGPNADAVERELDRCFAKVVLAPMIDWDGGEAPVYTKPAILTTSLGAVVGQRYHHTPISPTRSQPHNPESDEITLLIDDDASKIDSLREGMGIAGTWVQLARQGDPVLRSKSNKYWYLDELASVIPSFWTTSEEKVI